MKKYLGIFSASFIAFGFTACSKNNGPAVAPLASVSFLANGSLYSWSQAPDPNYMAISIYTSTPGTYHFSASNLLSSNLVPAREVYLTFQSASLSVNAPYTFANTTTGNSYPPHSIAVANTTTVDLAHIYGASEPGDFATVTVTSLHDGMADGTFNATLTRMSDQAKISISNGTFKNVEVRP
jgi:hypothetical protein